MRSRRPGAARHAETEERRMTSHETNMTSRRALLGSAVASAAAGLTLGSTAAHAADDEPAGATRTAGERKGPPSRVMTGAEVAAARGWSMLRGSKVAVFSNPTGILPDTTHIVDDLARHDDLEIVAVFGPEHGFRGSAQA